VTWRSWVIECRGEYSQRLKSAHLTSGNEYSSWPTATARDWKGPNSENSIFRKDGKSRAMDTLDNAVATVATWPTPTVQEAGKIGNQANHGQLALSNHPALRGEVTREKFQKGRHGPPAPDNNSTSGSHLESWATPTARDHKSGRGNEEREYKELTPMVERTQTGKLNPRWVETLMGLPVGWTMPSCASPVTIEPMNLDY
jgi:hypothetical protein